MQPEIESSEKKIEKITKFIIATQDCSGYGFAKMLEDQNDGRGAAERNKGQIEDVIMGLLPKEKEDDEDTLRIVGDGVVQRENLEKLFHARKKYKDYAWIFDMNFGDGMADQLRAEGFYVMGGHDLTDKLEHDREYGLSLIKKAGLSEPPSKKFLDIQSGLDFLEKNDMIAYVFKPDEPDDHAWVTTAPDNDNDQKANTEMQRFLSSQGEGKGDYILQERKKGVELNVEMWLYKGRPFFAHGNFECKRKDDGDHGRMIGCAQDIEFMIPLDCKVLKETLWKLIDIKEFKDYTGFIDMNLIVADNKYWFLEFCGRFGYNSHPNLFLTIAISPIGDILSDFLTGNVDDFEAHFRPGFGASITCWIDKPVQGLPLIFDNDQDVETRFFHFDTYRGEGDEYFLAGYANEVGIIAAHDYDLKSAAEAVLAKFEKIHYPGRTARTDLALTNYLSNPQERWIACQAMKLFDII